MSQFHKFSKVMLFKMRLEKALWDLANCFVEWENGPFRVKRPILGKLMVIWQRSCCLQIKRKVHLGRRTPAPVHPQTISTRQSGRLRSWQRRKKKNLLIPLNREEHFPNSVCHLMGYFGKFYKLQTCKWVQRPLVFFKPFEKQVKPCVAHTPKGKKKGGGDFINLKKRNLERKLKQISYDSG